MAKQINCGICAFRGDTVAMVLVKNFFQCPECKAQTYDNDEGNDAFVRHYKNQTQNEYISRAFQPGTHIQGGSDAVGSCKKGAMKKKSLSQVNAGLNGKCTSFDG